MPSNIKQNFFSPVDFSFVIQRLPYANFFVQRVSLPSFNLGVVEQGTPFRTMYFTGDRPEYGDLTVETRLDENLNTYAEIMNWMISAGFPDNFDQFKVMRDASKFDLTTGEYSDASLIVHTSGKNPNMEFKFQNIFPVSLTEIEVDTTMEDVVYPVCSITFKIQKFTLAPIAT